MGGSVAKLYSIKNPYLIHSPINLIYILSTTCGTLYFNCLFRSLPRQPHLTLPTRLKLSSSVKALMPSVVPGTIQKLRKCLWNKRTCQRLALIMALPVMIQNLLQVLARYDTELWVHSSGSQPQAMFKNDRSLDPACPQKSLNQIHLGWILGTCSVDK